jgi:hypothetical protein
MKLIINGDRIAATALDEYVAPDASTLVITAPEGFDPALIDAYRYVDGALVIPPPDVVSRFQAKAALSAAGLLPAVEAALADADPIAQLAWAEAIEFRRNSPTILGLAAALGLTSAQVDDLFHAAAAI